jgi:hypothetical protein
MVGAGNQSVTGCVHGARKCSFIVTTGGCTSSFFNPTFSTYHTYHQPLLIRHPFGSWSLLAAKVQAKAQYLNVLLVTASLSIHSILFIFSHSLSYVLSPIYHISYRLFDC